MANLKRYKYPRTPHHPLSRGATSDDVFLSDEKYFIGKDVVIMEKLDGENTTLYPDFFSHARSVDSRHHVSRDWIKQDWAKKAWKMDPESRLVGENLYAQHSIHYENLESYFYGFAYMKGDWVEDWDTTLSVMRDFGYPTPREFFRGKYEPEIVRNIIQAVERQSNLVEGVVIRTTQGFRLDQFDRHVAKYVRENHVQSDKHWTQSEIVPNKLRSR